MNMTKNKTLVCPKCNAIIFKKSKYINICSNCLYDEFIKETEKELEFFNRHPEKYDEYIKTMNEPEDGENGGEKGST